MAPVLTSISPASGPPGSLVTLTGAGFDPGSQAALPTLVETEYVDAGTLTAAIPEELAGPAGGTIAIGAWVRNADGAHSAVLPFVVTFPAVKLQTWTTIEAVAGEVPGFARNGRIKDEQIQIWMRSVAQAIAAAMLRRGLSLDPADWQQPDGAASPSPEEALEMINRLGAAARLAAAIGAEFSQGEWGVAKNLQAAYKDEKAALCEGEYDKLFRPGAATVESGPGLSAGDMTRADGSPSGAFTKGKVF